MDNSDRKMIAKDLGYQLIKDVADFKKATGDTPTKILIDPDVLDNLEKSWVINNDEFEGIEVQKSSNINKDWIVI